MRDWDNLVPWSVSVFLSISKKTFQFFRDIDLQRKLIRNLNIYFTCARSNINLKYKGCLFAVVISRTSRVNPKSHHLRVMNKLFKHAFDPFQSGIPLAGISLLSLSLSLSSWNIIPVLKKFSFAQSPLPLLPSASCDNRISSNSNYSSHQRRTILSNQRFPPIPQILSRRYENPTMFSAATKPSPRILVAPRIALYIERRGDERNKTRGRVLKFIAERVRCSRFSQSKETVITLSRLVFINQPAMRSSLFLERAAIYYSSEEKKNCRRSMINVRMENAIVLMVASMLA